MGYVEAQGSRGRGVAGGSGRRYAIVSPVRNEADVIRHTLDSVVGQTEPPVLWVIVDDGSTDDTARIVDEYAARAPFIKLLPVSDNESSESADRLMWAAEAIAFNRGLAHVDLDEIDYIVKLDGDLAFGEAYFASLLDEFDKDETLGMAGGYCYAVHGDRRQLEWNPPSHVRGPTKVYRLACFRDIGGIKPVYGWDGLDVIEAQMAGWRTQSFDFPVEHLRPTGSRGGQLKGIARGGRGAYLLGYHPLFALVRGAKYALYPPYVMNSVAFIYGYLAASITRPPRSADEATIAYLRQQQMRRLRAVGTSFTEMRSMFGREGR